MLCSPGLAGSAAGPDLPGPAQVIVVVHLDPVDGTDRCDRDLAATVGQFLVAVLVVQPWIALPGGLQRIGQRRRGTGLDQRGPDVLAVGERRVHPLRSEERRVGKECRSRWAPG